MSGPSPSPPLSYAIPPSLSQSCFALSPTAFLATNSHIQRLIAGAIVFDAPPGTEPHVLLLRRAAKDSFPLKWEVPGGCVDPTDPSLVDAAARELWEETSLRATRVVRAVDMAPREELPRHMPMERAEEEVLASGERVCVFREGTTTWAKGTFLVEVEEGEVKVRDDEHSEWAWVGEAEVRAGRFADGRALDLVSEGVRRTVLEGFRLQKRER